MAKVLKLFNGETRSETIVHRPTALGLAAEFDAAGSGVGWGAALKITREEAVNLDVYEGAAGGWWMSVPRRIPLPVVIE